MPTSDPATADVPPDTQSAAEPSGASCIPRTIATGTPRENLERPSGLTSNLEVTGLVDADGGIVGRAIFTDSTNPADFTGPYVLLASRERSGTITGEAISADGGMGVRGFGAPAGGDRLLELVTQS